MPEALPSPDAPLSQGGPVESLPPIRGSLDPGIVAAVELLRAEGLSTTDSGDGYSKKGAISDGQALNFGHVFIQVDQGLSAADVVAYAKLIPWTDYGYQVPTVELLERAPDSASDEPEVVGVMWQPGELMDTGAPAPAKAAALCLHCKQNPATKAEDDKGFTLCDDCWHKSELEPVVATAATCAAAQISEAEALAAETMQWRAAARKMAHNLLFHGPMRHLTDEQFRALGPDDLVKGATASVIRLESVCDQAAEVRYLCQQLGIETASMPLVDLFRLILISDVDYQSRYALIQLAEKKEQAAVGHEECAVQCYDEAAEYRRWARGEA